MSIVIEGQKLSKLLANLKIGQRTELSVQLQEICCPIGKQEFDLTDFQKLWAN
jgi:hypothetical protein